MVPPNIEIETVPPVYDGEYTDAEGYFFTFYEEDNKTLVINDINDYNHIGILDSRYKRLTSRVKILWFNQKLLKDTDYFNKLKERLYDKKYSLVYSAYRFKSLNDISPEKYNNPQKIDFVTRQGVHKTIKILSVFGKKVTLLENPENYLKLRNDMELKINGKSYGFVEVALKQTDLENTEVVEQRNELLLREAVPRVMRLIVLHQQIVNLLKEKLFNKLFHYLLIVKNWLSGILLGRSK